MKIGRVRTEIACRRHPIRRNLVWSRREGNQRDGVTEGPDFGCLATLGTTLGPNLSQVFPNSLHRPSPKSKFRVDSTYL